MTSHIQLLVTRLGDLPDPRQAGKVSYPLAEMTLTCVAGVVADCDEYKNIFEFSRDQLEWLRQFLPFEHGVASEDTFARVFSVMNLGGEHRMLRAIAFSAGGRGLSSTSATHGHRVGIPR